MCVRIKAGLGCKILVGNGRHVELAEMRQVVTADSTRFRRVRKRPPAAGASAAPPAAAGCVHCAAAAATAAAAAGYTERCPGCRAALDVLLGPEPELEPEPEPKPEPEPEPVPAHDVTEEEWAGLDLAELRRRCAELEHALAAGDGSVSHCVQLQSLWTTPTAAVR